MPRLESLVWIALSCTIALPAPVQAEELACGQIIVVAFAGAVASSATRSKDEAKARADVLRKQAEQGDFAAIARSDSDAPSSAPRGGVMGTFSRADWPALHEKLKAPVFRLKEQQIAPKPIEAPYGFVVLRRCKVELAHARHLLVRYAGAKNAKPDVTRTREQARALAEKLRGEIRDEKSFLEAIAKHSEDSSRERAGDIGTVGRGRLALPFENALFAMKVGERSGVVESEFGFHIIERLAEK